MCEKTAVRTVQGPYFTCVEEGPYHKLYGFRYRSLLYGTASPLCALWWAFFPLKTDHPAEGRCLHSPAFNKSKSSRTLRVSTPETYAAFLILQICRGVGLYPKIDASRVSR